MNWSKNPSESFQIVYHVYLQQQFVVPSGGISTTHANRQNQHSNTELITNQLAQTQNTKGESENNQFNEVRQLANVLEAERRRSYSTNRVISVIKRSKNSIRETTY